MTIVQRHRVRYHEVDSQGFLFNSRYLELANVATIEYFRYLGWPYTELERNGVDISVVSAQMTFLKPGRFDDVLDIDVHCVRVGRSSFELAMEIVRDTAPLARLAMIYVNVDAASETSRPVPDHIADMLRADAANGVETQRCSDLGIEI